MNSGNAAVLNTAIRVQLFLDANGDSLGTINQSGYRAILDDVVQKLSASAVAQTGSKRSAAAQAAKERVLRNALKINNMRPIATIAAAQLRQVPEFLALKMPPTPSTSRALIAWAGAMGDAAALYTKAFVDAGLPPDFLTALAGAADALNTAIASRGTTKSTLNGATAALDAEATRGRQAFKVLNSLVEPLLAGNVSLLAQWKAASRVGGRATAITSTSIDAAAKGPIASPNAEPATTPTSQATTSQPTADQPAVQQTTTQSQSTVDQSPATPSATA